MNELEGGEVDSKKRVSIRLNDWRSDRFMIVFDFGEIQTIGDFFNQVQAMFP